MGQHAKCRSLREELYRAFITRASSGGSDNGPIIERILVLRRERAELLGFSNHAEVRGRVLSRTLIPSADFMDDSAQKAINSIAGPGPFRWGMQK